MIQDRAHVKCMYHMYNLMLISSISASIVLIQGTIITIMCCQVHSISVYPSSFIYATHWKLSQP